MAYSTDLEIWRAISEETAARFQRRRENLARIAERDGIEIVEIKLSEVDPADFGGFPVVRGDAFERIPLDKIS